jgi:ABC-type amino acid transport substrate-binding protein
MVRSCIFFIVIIIFSFAEQPLAGTVDIITFSYPPLMNDDGTGILSQLVTRIYKDTNVTPKFMVYPRKRAVFLFKSPDTDGLFLGERMYFQDIPTIQAQKFAEFKTVFVYLKNRFPKLSYTTLTDLKGMKVGISMGSVFRPMFESAGLFVDEAKLENNVLKLKSNRIDLWHTVDLAAETIINKEFPGRLQDFGFLTDKIHSVDIIVKRGSPSEKAFQIFVKNYSSLMKENKLQPILKDFKLDPVSEQ